jgi:hypothetical protein
MTAGVQNLESAAHVPPPPSVSAPDTKGAGAADKQAASTPAGNTFGEQLNFQSELQLQDAGTPETKSDGSLKTASGKAGKKRDTRPEVPNLAAVTPVQPAAPQKQILPLALALRIPDENAQPDDNPQEAAQSLKPRRSFQAVQSAETKIPAANVAPSPTPDFSQIQIQSLPAEVPAPEQATKSGEPTTAFAKPGTSSDSQAVSRAQLKLADAIPPEPVATAVQEAVESAPSSPSALAFAARLALVPQKTDQPLPASPSPTSAVPDAQTPARIPVRYPATAQVLQSGASEIKQSASGSARTDFRMEMALPQIELANEAPPSSGPATTQPAAPSAPVERIIEPPAAPPTSAHDIRVQVPDNNGGSTQVRFVESGGEVRVSVRTADEGLAQNLRSHLNDLTQRLTDGGMPAEVWKPGATSSQNSQPQPDREGRGSGGQQSSGQDRQQDRQQKRPAWLDEMEASLHE